MAGERANASLPEGGRSRESGGQSGIDVSPRKVKGANLSRLCTSSPLIFSGESRPELTPHRSHGLLNIAAIGVGANLSDLLIGGDGVLRHASGRGLTGRVNHFAGDGRWRLMIPVFVHDVAMTAVATGAAATAAITNCVTVAAAARTATSSAAAIAARVANDGRPQPHQRTRATGTRADEVCTLIAGIAAIRRIADPFAPITFATATTVVAATIEPILDAATARAAGQARSATAGSAAAAITTARSTRGAASRTTGRNGWTAFDATARFADQPMAEGATWSAAAAAGRKKCNQNRR
jgi:hypothetical protein